MRSALDGLGFVPPLHSPEEDNAFMAGLLLGAETWVAEAEGKPVGFIAVVQGANVPALYVHPEWQARGIGRALMHAAMQGRASLTLRCFQQNAIACRFYEALGFRDVARDAVGNNDEGLPDITYHWDSSTRDWSKGAAWMDGRVIPIGEARIGVTDWGLTRSDITYDVA
ncbi:MAG: GNAT family N-acetyltransferase [Pseudomonadota bacterium]